MSKEYYYCILCQLHCLSSKSSSCIIIYGYRLGYNSSFFHRLGRKELKTKTVPVLSCPCSSSVLSSFTHAVAGIIIKKKERKGMCMQGRQDRGVQ